MTSEEWKERFYKLLTMDKKMNMTPKIKADELVESFYNEFAYMIEFGEPYKAAKQCALIAVDEILNVCPFISIEYAISEGGKESDAQKYWEQVRVEIRNL
jgi:adenylate cyclase class IV